MNFFEYVADNLDELVPLFLEHVQVVVVAVIAATVIGVALGVATYRTDQPRQAVLGVTSTFLTIPSFALFVLMIPLLGLGFRPTVVALVMYGLLPIVRNTITGLREVDAAIVESAQGMGMGRWKRLLRIELPLAWPVIVTGIRVATQLLVGIAAIGAIVLGPGLGEPIFAGLGRLGSANAVNQIASGVVGVIIVAILFDLAYNVLIRLTTPRGIR